MLNVRFAVTACYCIGILLLIWAAHPILLSNLHDQWTTSGELDFGYFVLVIAVAVAVMQVKHLIKLNWQIEFRFLVPALIGVLFAFCGLWINTQSILIVGLVILWWSLMLALLGSRAWGKVTIAAGLILAAMPLIFVLIPVLRAMTVFAVTQAVQVFGILAFIEGNLIHMATGVIEIADGCSGTKYFHTAVVLALVVQGFDLSRQSVFKVFALLMAAAILANWVRVFVLVVWAYHTSVTDPLILDHDWLGWVVFALFMFYPLHYLTADTQSPAPGSMHGASFAYSKGGIGLLACIAVTLVFAPSMLNNTLDQRSQWQEVEMPRLVDTEGNPCKESSGVSHWQPHFVGADMLEVKAAVCGNLNFEYAMAQYWNESQGKELIYWNNGPFDPEKWRVKQNESGSFSDGSPGKIVVASNLASGLNRIALFQYGIGDYKTIGGLQTKILGLLRLSSGELAPRALVIAVACVSDCEDERERLDGQFSLEAVRPS